MSSLQKSRKYIPYRSKPIDSTRFINFLFPESCKNHKEGIVKQYFNHFYDMGEFIEMIESLMRMMVVLVITLFQIQPINLMTD